MKIPFVQEQEIKRITAGDSGSPLLIPIGSGQFVQAGLAFRSTGGQGSDGVVRLFGLYTRASSIYEWAQNYIGQLKPTILTHVFSGDLNGNDSWTEVIGTNREGRNCSANLIFSQGTQEAPSVYFNGEMHSGNQVTLPFPAYSTRSIQITSPDNQFIHGSLYIEGDCSSLNVQGRYLIQNRQGEIQEVFSVNPQTQHDWMNGGCLDLASKFGNGRNVGLAFVTAQRGDVAPEGTQLSVASYDWDWQDGVQLASLLVTGQKTALNPWKLEGSKMIQICRDNPDPNSSFQLAIVAIGAKATQGRVQYFTEDLMGR